LRDGGCQGLLLVGLQGERSVRKGTMACMASDDDELGALRASCTRFLSGHGPQDAAQLLATIPADTELDRYGEGGVVAVLEAEVAGLPGKPAAVFLPRGTMAQQSVLRVHAGRRGSRTVGFHPACHIDRHEGRGYERLHALADRLIGDPNRLLSLGDLDAAAEPPAALLLELPQRDLGGQQPTWDDLRAQAAWAREHARPCSWMARGCRNRPQGTARHRGRWRRCSAPSTCRSTRGSARSQAAA
jgi:hypothetical protein